MNNRVMKTAFALSIIMALTVGTVFAISSDKEILINIGFDFKAGDELLPAGEYRIGLLPHTQSSRFLLIRSTDGQHSAIVQTMPGTKRDGWNGAELAFNQYGEQRFLARVQLGDGTAIHDLFKTSAERKVAKDNTDASSFRIVRLRVRSGGTAAGE